MKKACLALLLFALSVCAVQADEEDVTNAKDHPLFSRLPQYVINEYEQNYNEQEFFLDSETKVRLEGRRTYLRYVIKDDAQPASSLQILRNYANAISKLGGQAVYEGETEESARQGTYKLVHKGQETWVKVAPGADGGVYDLVVLEKGEMPQEVTTGEMMDALNKDGRVALYLNFDTDKADIKPEFKPVLDVVAALMRENPGLRLGVEGHTDDQGGGERNQKLSQRRAQAVVQAVVKAGVDQSRLTARGWGQAKPLVANDTEEGRAQNRRVELVRQ